MSHPNQSTALAETMVDELVRCGVRLFVVAPGSRSAALAIAVARSPHVELVVEIDERSAGFLALGRAKADGRPAAVIVTSGSAVANLLPSVVEADLSQTPMVLLTADRPPELHGVGANQTIEQSGIFGRHVRWAVDVAPSVDRPAALRFWRSSVDQAVAHTLGWNGRRGPVQLNLAFEEPLIPRTDDGRTVGTEFVSTADDRSSSDPWTRWRGLDSRPEELDDEWSEIDRGLVVAGSSSVPIAQYADQLAAALGWPLVAEPSCGGRPAQSISTIQHLAQSEVFADRYRPDAVLTIGATGLSRPLARLIENVPRVATLGWNDPTRRAEVVYPGLVTASPRRKSASSDRRAEWRRDWLRAEHAGRRALDSALDSLDGLTEARVARDVGRAVPRGGALVVASSTPIRDVDRYLAPGSFRIIANRGASGIDGFASLALGVALAMPVVSLVGDLSFLHDSNAFLARPRPAAVFVVIDNDGGGIFSYLPQAMETDVFDRVFGTPTNVDIESLANVHGIGYCRLHDPSDLVPRVVEASTSPDVEVIHVRVDRASHVALAQRLTGLVVDAVASDLR